MDKLKFTATLRSPIITRGFLTFDSLLAALAFEELQDPEAAVAAVPLKRTGDLFHGSAAVLENPFAAGATCFTASLRGTHDLHPDYDLRDGRNQSRTRFSTKRRRDFGNVMSHYKTTSCASVSWYCEGDADKIAELIQGARFIGKKRASGYGEVAGWSTEKTDLDGVLDADGLPMRPIPVEMFQGDQSSPKSEAAWRPAYWDPRNRTICYAPVKQHR